MSEIKTLPFFGKDGLTSTSANHIANLAKEAVRDCHERLAAIQFYTETVGLLTSDKEATVKVGMETVEVNSIPSIVEQIYRANSLIAFLREAIKEKERRMKEAEQWTDTEKEAALRNDRDALVPPQKEEYPTEDDIKKTWSIGQQEKYLSLEAEASALGKLVHESGFLSLARIDLMKKIQNPSKVELNGSDTLVHTFTPTVPLENVDAVFNTLQARYRAVQAELNGMKKAIDDAIFSRKQEIDEKYVDDLRAYRTAQRDIENRERLLEEETKIHCSDLKKEVESLRIVIPKRLEPFYQSLVHQQ